MKNFKLGTALIDGSETVVVGLGPDIHRLDKLLRSDVPTGIDGMLCNWEEWCDRIASALLATDCPGKVAEATIAWLPPVRRPPKLICLGTNYGAHAAEVSADPLKLPYAFLKPPSTTLRGSGCEIQLLSSAAMNDWEIELAAVIGREARNVSVADALSHVAGYTVMNDVSVRDHVADRSKLLGVDWVLAKAADGYAPIGPWVTPTRFVPNPQGLDMELTVNDVTMQKGNTTDMLFGVASTIAHLSRTMTLEAGDIIATGTPEGVGFGRKPPVFLQHGDVVRCTIAGLGTLENRFVRG
jgi:2-keto-4-pentenoate hydratase/2-oxohepta-3-ene-1,7-dioic acid hydratase in catechol pathway